MKALNEIALALLAVLVVVLVLEGDVGLLIVALVLTVPNEIVAFALARAGK